MIRSLRLWWTKDERHAWLDPIEQLRYELQLFALSRSMQVESERGARSAGENEWVKLATSEDEQSQNIFRFCSDIADWLLGRSRASASIVQRGPDYQQLIAQEVRSILRQHGEKLVPVLLEANRVTAHISQLVGDKYVPENGLLSPEAMRSGFNVDRATFQSRVDAWVAFSKASRVLPPQS